MKASNKGNIIRKIAMDNNQIVECEVCGREHDWDDPHRRHNRQETDLTNGECIDHCRECDPLSVRPGLRKAEQ